MLCPLSLPSLFFFQQDLGALTVWVMRDYDSVEPIILSVPEKDEVRCSMLLELLKFFFSCANVCDCSLVGVVVMALFFFVRLILTQFTFGFCY